MEQDFKNSIIKASELSPEVKAALEIIYPEVFPENISIGDIFVRREENGDDDKYILCQSSHCLIQLIHIKSGNRWTAGASVKCPHDITQEEWKRIVGADYYLKFKKSSL